MNYLCAALALAAVIIGWLYINAASDLDAARLDLAAVKAANRENEKTIALLQSSADISSRAVSDLADDRITAAALRRVVNAAVKEAMRDEIIRQWAADAAPADAWRLLESAGGQNGTGHAGDSGGPAASLPGNTSPGGRD